MAQGVRKQREHLKLAEEHAETARNLLLRSDNEPGHEFAAYTLPKITSHQAMAAIYTELAKVP